MEKENINKSDLLNDTVKTTDYKELYENLLKEFEQYKKESVKWSVEDFLEYGHPYYKINKRQAQKALEHMIRNHDASIGINWNDVEYYIEQYGVEIKHNNN